jgi:hypothetical protein
MATNRQTCRGRGGGRRRREEETTEASRGVEGCSVSHTHRVKATERCDKHQSYRVLRD